jgi:hypothetical protein
MKVNYNLKGLFCSKSSIVFAYLAFDDRLIFDNNAISR